MEWAAWIAFVMLAVVALLGWTMFAIWWQRRQREPVTGAAAGGERPAEQHFPVSIVALHGVLAVTTVVLVFLTAIGVGGGSGAACGAEHQKGGVSAHPS